MRTTVSKWGNSLAIRLPKAAVEGLDVHVGEAVDLAIEGDSLVIRPRRPRYTIEALVGEMHPEDEPDVLDDAATPSVGSEML